MKCEADTTKVELKVLPEERWSVVLLTVTELQLNRVGDGDGPRVLSSVNLLWLYT